MSRPLHAVFSELLTDEAAQQAYAADPSGFLGDAGHPGLPDELVAEAIVGFADTASPAVAEHLAAFVKTHGPVHNAAEPGHEANHLTALDGLTLLADAPAGDDDSGRDETADLLDPAAATGAAALGEPASAVDDLGFGTGSDLTTTGSVDEASTALELDTAPLDEDVVTPAPSHGDEPLVAEPFVEIDEAKPADDLDTE